MKRSLSAERRARERRPSALARSTIRGWNERCVNVRPADLIISGSGRRA
jgi:hypothetical protein